MIKRTVRVYGRRTEVVNEPTTPRGNLNADAILFEVDDEWAGFTLTAQFKSKAGVVYAVIPGSDNVAMIPNEIINVGGAAYDVTLVGTKGTQRLVSMPIRMVVQNTKYSDSTTAPSTSVTPTVAEQLTARVVASEASVASAVSTANAASSAANAAVTKSNAVYNAYASGELNGADGADGTDGVDGVSPTVAITDITGGKRITITDKDGSHYADILNGATGANGADGSSVTVDINTIQYSANLSGVKLMLTDKNGVHVAYLYNGTRGEKGEKGEKGDTGTVTAEAIRAAIGYTPASASDISAHNSSSVSHSDIRALISGLSTRLNAVADSDDVTLDQLSEIVGYIKDNRELIDSVTTAKADASVVSALSETVNGKADAGTVSALSETVNGKADAGTVSALSETVSGKADASAVSALSETVSAQNEAIAQKVSGVKVAGTALTKDADGAVDVPKGSNDTFGVVRPYYNRGLTFYNINGVSVLGVKCSDNGNINDRTSNYFPIAPVHLDYAVKSALCDGKGAAYTATEQAAARARIGAAANTQWSVSEATIAESNLRTYDIIFDDTASELFVRIYTPVLTDYTNTNWYPTLLDEDGNAFAEDEFNVTAIWSHTSQESYGFIHVRNDNGCLSISFAHRSASAQSVSTLQTAPYKNGLITSKNIKGIRMQCSSESRIMVGTKFTVTYR